MSDPNEILTKARALLREGGVQAADDLITKHFADQAAAGANLPEGAAPAAAPRTFSTVVMEILTVLIGLSGNPDPLLTLLEELATKL